MSSEFELNLEKYVDVILKVGLNLQKGQRLLIIPFLFGNNLIELAPFIELIAKKAYQKGARFVEVIWDDPQMDLIRLKYAPRDSFEEFSVWKSNAKLEFAEKGDAVLGFVIQNPDLFADQDPELMKIMMQTYLKHNKKVSNLALSRAFNWTYISAPSEGWTNKIFPDLPPDNQNTKMWDVIFDICRIKQKDPISAWKNHIEQLQARVNYLNDKQYETLRLDAPGTDLTIGLPKGHIWHTAGVKSQNGISYVLNLPTEEIYTTPHKDKTEGVITMTKPLFYSGPLIEDIKLTFSKGKTVELNAGKGKEFLENIIKTDEGANRLGEVALVPHSSPISQTELIFYNGLIDENASCHIALGKGFKFCLENGDKMSDEEFRAAGGNNSLVHIDCMVGSGEMNIDGITSNGTVEPIMRNGEWAFDV
ncbi:MAG: aminopeptidase [Promethearchaeota archaeon]